MGYEIGIHDSEFHIDNEDTQAALNAITEMMDEAGHTPRDKAFAWMNGVDPDEWDYLKEAMKDWRFPVEFDDELNVVGINFTGQKIGDEEQMFDVIAPYVETGSYITFFGRGDGYRWRIEFHEDEVEEVSDV